MQLVNLLETAGRELLALQKIVGDSNPLNPAGKSFHTGFGAGTGVGPFGSFGGGAAAGAAASAAAVAGGAGGVGATGVGGRDGGNEAQRQRDVVRLCAVMEITSVLLCTLSMALSQVLVLIACLFSSVVRGHCGLPFILSFCFSLRGPVLLWVRVFAYCVSVAASCGAARVGWWGGSGVGRVTGIIARVPPG